MLYLNGKAMKKELEYLKSVVEREREESLLLEKVYGVYPEDTLVDDLISKYVELLSLYASVSEDTLYSFVYDFNFGEIEGLSIDDVPINSIDDFCAVYSLED